MVDATAWGLIGCMLALLCCYGPNGVMGLYLLDFRFFNFVIRLTDSTQPVPDVHIVERGGLRGASYIVHRENGEGGGGGGWGRVPSPFPALS